MTKPISLSHAVAVLVRAAINDLRADVSLDAVPFHGGSYWIVTRDNAILLAFQFEATIGGNQCNGARLASFSRMEH